MTFFFIPAKARIQDCDELGAKSVLTLAFGAVTV
jgi:hypothetical protein